MDAHKFPVDLVGAAGGVVGLLLLQLGREFRLAPLEVLNLFLQQMDNLPLAFQLV